MEDREKIEWHERRVPVRLTDEERLQKGREIALACEELGSHQAESKAVKAQLGAREKEIQSRIQGLAALMRGGVEHRNVRCYGLVDLPNGRVKFYREDTREFVGDRAIRAEERQLPIPGTETGGELIAIDGGRAGEPFNPPKGLVNVFATVCGHMTAAPEGGVVPELCAACNAVANAPDAAGESAESGDDADGGPEEPA